MILCKKINKKTSTNIRADDILFCIQHCRQSPWSIYLLVILLSINDHLKFMAHLLWELTIKYTDGHAVVSHLKFADSSSLNPNVNKFSQIMISFYLQLMQITFFKITAYNINFYRNWYQKCSFFSSRISWRKKRKNF